VRIAHWFNAHTRTTLAFLLAVALLVRIATAVQFSESQLLHLERMPDTDMNYYDDWGRRIAGGDWLSRSVGVPMHSWQVAVATKYLTQHPDERTRLTPASTGLSSPEAGLWAQWMHTPEFYEDPLYPYAIGVTYWLFGPNARWVYLWQLLLGVATVGLMWSATHRAFGASAAALAGAMAAVGAPLVYYEFLMLRESVVVFAAVALIWLADRLPSRLRWRSWFAFGAAAGLACLLKSTLVLVAIGLVGVAWWRSERRPSALLLATLLGGAVAWTPLVARNVAVGAPPLASASTGPLTFMISNAADFKPEQGFSLSVDTLGEELARASRDPVQAIADAWQANGVKGELSLLWRKWRLVWHGYEIPNNENFYYLARRVPLLDWLPVSFAICAPLGLAGLFLSLRRRPLPATLAVLVVGALAPMLVFYVLGRFRLLLFAALIPFAASAVLQVVAWVRHGRFVQVGLLTATVAAMTVWATGPPLGNQPWIRSTDWLVPYFAHYQGEAESALRAGNPTAASAALLAYFSDEPTAAEIRASGNPRLAQWLGDLHAQCATLLSQAGRTAEAQDQAAKAETLARLTQPTSSR
jgi:4-amino-4-deoxy-L-arabinose transferase-like glycosyltransferase